MRLTTTEARWSLDQSGSWISFKSSDAAKVCSEIKDGKTYDIEVKEHRNKRSLDANAYCWLYIGKLAAVLNLSKEEVYRQFIREVGDNFVIVPLREDAVAKWIEVWQSRGAGWICESLGKSKLNGYENVISYYGSSTYDTKQMSLLITLVLEACREQGIDTISPSEASLLMDNWK